MGYQEVRDDIQFSVINPLLALRAKIASLNKIHNDCLTAYQNSIYGLLTGSDGQIAFQGSGATSFASIAYEYTNAAQDIVGLGDDISGTDLDGYMQSPVEIGEQIAQDLQTALQELDAQKVDDKQDSDSFEYTPSGNPIAAIAPSIPRPGGISSPWDIAIGGGLLLLSQMTGGTLDPDESKVQTATLIKQVTVQTWEKKLRDTEPLPELPDSPNNPKDGYNPFLKAIGITTGVTAGGVGAYMLWGEMSEQQRQQKIQELLAKYPECSEAELRSLIDKITTKYGDLPVEQIERIIKALRLRSQYAYVIQLLMTANYPSKDLLNQLTKTAKKYFGFGSNANNLPSDINNWPWPDNPDQWPSDKKLEDLAKDLTDKCAEVEVAQNLDADDINYEVSQANPNNPNETHRVDVVNDNTWIEVKNLSSEQKALKEIGSFQKQIWTYITNGAKHQPPITNFVLRIVSGIPKDYVYIDPVTGISYPGEEGMKRAILDGIKTRYDPSGSYINNINLTVDATKVPVCDTDSGWCQG